MSSVVRPAPLGYERALCLFCRQSALFEHYALCREAGIKIPERELERTMKLTKKAEEDLLIEKQNLGYEDGLEFITKPLYAQGFTLVGQKLTGNTRKLVTVLSPWRNVEKVTEKNHFRYEQATLALSHYYLQTGQYRMPGIWRVYLREIQRKLLLSKRERQRIRGEEAEERRERGIRPSAKDRLKNFVARIRKNRKEEAA